MSVLFVHNRYQQPGGEEAVMAAESLLLEERGHRVTRLVVDNDTIPSRAGPASRIALAIGTTWSRAGARLVADAARAAAPDVVHFHNTFPLLSPAVYGAARRTGAAVVQSIHNYRLVCPSATLFRDGHECTDCVGRTVPLPGVVHACYRDSRAATAAVAAMLGFHKVRGTWRHEVDAYLVYSAFAAKILARGGLPAARLHIKPNFVPVDPGTGDGPRAGFLFVGRLTREKGLDLVVDAWSVAPAGATCRIAGDGPLAGDLATAAERLPGLSPLGRIDPAAVRSEMRGASALVFASRTHEMAPLTIIEAFAAGLPVIGPRFGVVPTLVDDGATGILYEPGDRDALAAAVAWAMDHPAELRAMGTAARRRYEERHHPDATYRRLVEVYGVATERARARARAARSAAGSGGSAAAGPGGGR